jgi:hypothetical protein
MNFTGPPAAPARAQYPLGVDLRPAVVEIRACYGLQSYDIKTEWQGKSITALFYIIQQKKHIFAKKQSAFQK